MVSLVLYFTINKSESFGPPVFEKHWCSVDRKRGAIRLII